MWRSSGALATVAVLWVTCNSSVSENSFKRQATSTIRYCSETDIVFAIDSSSSIAPENWLKVKGFIKDIVRSLYTEAIHIGVVSFSNHGIVEFHLNKYANHQDIIDHVLNMAWKDQETNTSGAIATMRSMFDQKFGDRPGAPNIGIVLASGESNRDHEKTIPYAKLAHQDGIVMFAVGIDYYENDIELHGIATNASFVFHVEDFNVLSTIQDITTAACDTFFIHCPSNADIAFVLDASTSFGEENFNITKQVVKTMVENLNVDNQQSNIAVVTFSDNAQVHINLNDHNNRTDLINAIDNIPYARGSTNTSTALKLVREQVFGRQDKGDRPHMRNMLVVLTNGGSVDFSQTSNEARLARDGNITIVTVGIAGWINHVELREMASYPNDKNVFILQNVAVINELINDIKLTLCDAIDGCDSSPCRNGGTCVNGVNIYTCVCSAQYAGPNCEYICKPVDVVIAVDSSGIIGQQNYYHLLNFTKGLFRSMNTWNDHTRVGVETFASSVNVKFHLNSFNERDRIINAISFAYTMGTRDTAQALQVMRESMFTPTKGDRPNVHNIGIMLTVGLSDNKGKTFQQAVLTRNAGIDLLTVAINIKSSRGQEELRRVTSDPDSMNLVNVDSFADLDGVTERIMKSVCNTVNECDSNPCPHRTCVDGTNGYECTGPAWGTIENIKQSPLVR